MMKNLIFKKLCKNANNSTSYYRVWPHFCTGYNSIILISSGGPGGQFDQYMKPLLESTVIEQKYIFSWFRSFVFWVKAPSFDYTYSLASFFTVTILTSSGGPGGQFDQYMRPFIESTTIERGWIRSLETKVALFDAFRRFATKIARRPSSVQ